MADRLEEIESRLAKVTPGPWKLWGMSVMADPVGNSSLDDAIDVASTHMLVDGKPRTFDATFIAHAPTDLAALLAFVREIQALEVAARELAAKASADYERNGALVHHARQLGHENTANALRVALTKLEQA